MKALLSAGVAAAALVSLIPSAHGAALIVTEVMSSTTNGTTPDWFELTNTTGSALNITGYKIDDNSFSTSAAVALGGVSSIASGESVVFVLGAASDATAFKTFWGGAALTTQVGFFADNSTGLSASGDGVVIFTAANAEVTRVTFGSATLNVSFAYDASQFSDQAGFTGKSALGQNGAYSSAGSPTNIGSPGLIPEPGAGALLFAGLGLLARRPARRGA